MHVISQYYRAELIHSHGREKSLQLRSLKPIYLAINAALFGTVALLLILDNTIYPTEYATAPIVSTPIEKVYPFLNHSKAFSSFSSFSL